MFGKNSQTLPCKFLLGETLQIKIDPKEFPQILFVPKGSTLSPSLHRRVLSTHLFGDSCTTLGSALGKQDALPPLLLEDSENPDENRLGKKRQFAAYVWRKILNQIHRGLKERPYRIGKRDEWIFDQLLTGIAHIQHSLCYLERRHG